MSLLTAIKYMQAHDAREPAYASMIGLRVLSGAPPATLQRWSLVIRRKGLSP
jgi:hypothetical protein